VSVCGEDGSILNIAFLIAFRLFVEQNILLEMPFLHIGMEVSLSAAAILTVSVLTTVMANQAFATLVAKGGTGGGGGAG
jgi:hypothetical protein